MTIDDIYRYAEEQGIQVYELPLPGLQSISMPGDELSAGYIGISKDIDDIQEVSGSIPLVSTKIPL